MFVTAGNSVVCCCGRYHDGPEQQWWRCFCDSKLLFADCILDEIEDIVKFDTGNLCADDLNEKVVERNRKRSRRNWFNRAKLQESVETFLSLMMKNLKRGRNREYRVIRVLTRRGQSACGVNGQRNEMKWWKSLETVEHLPKWIPILFTSLKATNWIISWL